MKIIRAEKMGFCFGVAGAINLCNKIADETDKLRQKNIEETEKNLKENIKEKNFFEGNLFILGMLVHNKKVTSDMEKKGFRTLSEEDLREGKIKLEKKDTVIIRAHGTTKEIYDILEKEKVKISDATCVFVERIRKALIEAEEKGKKIIFIGDRFHPEVKGIVSFGKNVSVVNSFEEFMELPINPNEEYCLLTQTTLNKELFFQIKDYITDNYSNIEIFSKICGATYERQKAVEKLAKEVDMVIIVGDNKSSNSKKLYEISKSVNEKSYLIQDKTELDSSWFKDVERVGITAGASTPEEIILEIENEIRGTFDDKHGL